MNFKKQHLLVIAPHPDDEVIGCGGLIHRVKAAGGRVSVLYLVVDGAQDFSSRGRSTRDQRIREMVMVTKFLRIDRYRIAFPPEKHLRLDTVPQREIIHEIERGRGISLEATKPTILCIPSAFDYNQDHRAAAWAAISATRPAARAVKHTPEMILEFEYPPLIWSAVPPPHAPNIFLQLSPANLHAKVRAMRLYRSQSKHQLSSYGPRALDSLARLRGAQSGTSAAEAFVARRISM